MHNVLIVSKNKLRSTINLIHFFIRFSPFGVPAEFSTDWLYSAAARAWTKWLPKDSIHNFVHAGFYDVEIDPFFRIIVLNTNLCYGYNLYEIDTKNFR